MLVSKELFLQKPRIGKNQAFKMSTVRDSKSSDDPKTYIEGYVKTVAKNAELISKYPFLLPLGYDYKVGKDYDFTYIEADMVPQGWKNLIIDLSQELLELFQKNNIDPYRFHIEQLKEKFGTIRLYHNFDNSSSEVSEEIYQGVEDIIRKYEELSEHTCCVCGKEATLISKGWICPYCEDCANELKNDKESAHWEFVPLVKSTWKKLEVAG